MNALTRRKFMRLACAGPAALALSACARTVPPKTNRARIVVVGGGFGGATAAKYLKLGDPSLSVTLIDRVPRYLACPGSNEVVAGLRSIVELRHDYGQLARNYGVELVFANVTGVDFATRAVRLDGRSPIPFDRLVCAPGVDFRWDAIEGYDEEASQYAPHAWKAGDQTVLLQRKLQAMPDGGVVLISVPENPYRCPPGPYERASLIAYYLKREKPRSKLLILDAKTKFSKQALFEQGWKTLYPGLIDWISSEKEGRIEYVDAKQGALKTEFNRYRADVLNVIPPQKAGSLAIQIGLTDDSGWCPINPLTFESLLAPNVHVIGDACLASPMPKSAFSANVQAKACAAAIVDLIAERNPEPAALINHCYSFLSPELAISVTGVYRFSAQDRSLTTLAAAETPATGDRRMEAKQARSWYELFMADVFG